MKRVLEILLVAAALSMGGYLLRRWLLARHAPTERSLFARPGDQPGADVESPGDRPQPPDARVVTSLPKLQVSTPPKKSFQRKSAAPPPVP